MSDEASVDSYVRESEEKVATTDDLVIAQIAALDLGRLTPLRQSTFCISIRTR
ncbi:MAG: hypothetical protein V8R85_05105 [Frisingicoccus sp.]